MYSCTNIYVAVLLSTARHVTSADDCWSPQGYNFDGINWNYKPTGYPVDATFDIKKPTTGVKTDIFCISYMQLPTAKTGFWVDLAQEDKKAPSKDPTNRLGLDGIWTTHEICGGKAIIGVFNATKKYHIQQYLEYCRSYKYEAAQPTWTELFYDQYAETQNCPQVYYGSYVQVYDKADPKKTFMYVEPKTTGRIRLLELQLAVCNYKKPPNSNTPIWGSFKPAGTMYSGIDWHYPRYYSIPDLTHYRYGDGKDLGVEPIATRPESSPSYCVSLERSFDDDDYHHTWKRSDRSPISGTWQAEFLCNKSAWIQVFVVEEETKEIKRAERECMWSSHIAAQIQPNWASVYRFNGSENYKGIYLEIFNNEMEFGVKYKRSFFTGDQSEDGVIKKAQLEQDICMPSHGSKPDGSAMRKKKKLATATNVRKTKIKCGKPMGNDSKEII